MANSLIEFNTVVIGAGQAGLSMSYHLSRQRLPHIVLERARVAERWRSERWDSLHFQFPNAFVNLPGYAYDGDEPGGFMHRDEVVRRLQAYASTINVPLRTGVEVTSLAASTGGGFTLEASTGPIKARHVVVATGPYHKPRIPEFAANLTASVRQLPASRYTSAQELPQGAVLVVGAGGSGCQIAEDLALQGRETFLAVSPHRRLPRRHAGRDITYWLEESGFLDRTAAQMPVHGNAPLLTGVDGGYEVSISGLSDKGVRLVGRLLDADQAHVQILDSVAHDIAVGEQSYMDALAMIEAFREGIAPMPPVAQPTPEFSRYELDLEQAGIASIVWATGYTLDFGWIRCDVFDNQGRPRHERGITDVEGLLFLGLPLLHTVRSSFLWGVGADAQYLAQHIAELA